MNKNGNLIVTSYDFSKKESLKKRKSSDITLFDRNAFMKDGTLVPSEDWLNFNIKNYNLSSSDIQFHIAENEQKIDDMTNYVLKKLQKAGIEVVTDKEEFARILEGQALLQKMTSSEYYNREVDAFITDKAGFVDPEKIAAIDLYGFEKAKEMWKDALRRASF